MILGEKRLCVLFLITCCSIVGLTGCLSPIALERAVLQYDRKVQLIKSEILLLNVARAKQHLPGHFTTVSSIAATFDFQVNTGFLGNFGPNINDAFTLS